MTLFEELFEDSFKQIKGIQSLADLEALRGHFLGKKGPLSSAMRELATLPPETRKERGAHLNQLKEEWLQVFHAQKEKLAAQEMAQRMAQETCDVSLPLSETLLGTGRLHPLSYTTHHIIHIFEKMGFSVRSGPDIETDFYNFTALNIPPLHPARTSQDTFYLAGETDGDGKPLLLRTHTSPVEIRTMMTEKPPIRIIAPGRVFRADYDQTHTPMFHQMEGLVVDKGIHMGHLKGCLEEFCRLFFGKPVPLRFRPSFFPFTEPSAEVDILCDRSGSELIIGQGTDWLEVLGCGMLHPQVLSNCGLDPTIYQAFAFGMGVERLTMLTAGITDLRRFFENDTRWLAHYGFGLTD